MNCSCSLYSQSHRHLPGQLSADCLYTFRNSGTGCIHHGDSFNKCLWHFTAVIRRHPLQLICWVRDCSKNRIFGKISWFAGRLWWFKIINQAQNDLKSKLKNHTDDLKSRFKIIRFEIIPNTGSYCKSVKSFTHVHKTPINTNRRELWLLVNNFKIFMPAWAKFRF